MAKFQKEFPCPVCGQMLNVSDAKRDRAEMKTEPPVVVYPTYIHCLGCSTNVCCMIDNDLTLIKLNNIIKDTIKAKKEKREIIRKRLLKDMHSLDRSLDEDRRILAKSYAGMTAYIQDGDKEFPIELGVVNLENQ